MQRADYLNQWWPGLLTHIHVPHHAWMSSVMLVVSLYGGLVPVNSSGHWWFSYCCQWRNHGKSKQNKILYYFRNIKWLTFQDYQLLSSPDRKYVNSYHCPYAKHNVCCSVTKVTLVDGTCYPKLKIRESDDECCSNLQRPVTAWFWLNQWTETATAACMYRPTSCPVRQEGFFAVDFAIIVSFHLYWGNMIVTAQMREP